MQPINYKTFSLDIVQLHGPHILMENLASLGYNKLLLASHKVNQILFYSSNILYL